MPVWRIFACREGLSERPASAPFWTAPLQPRSQRQISTGTVECVSTRTAWLPSSTRDRPRRPCDAMTIRSQPLSLAVRMMPSAGNSVTCTVSHATPCVLRLSGDGGQDAGGVLGGRLLVLIDRKHECSLAGHHRRPGFGDGDGGNLRAECLGELQSGCDGLAGQLRSVRGDQQVLVHGCLRRSTSVNS